MVLVDTSAWIEYLRGAADSRTKDRVEQLIACGEAAFTYPTRFELLAGDRKHEAKVLTEGLGFCHHMPFEPPYWIHATRMYRGPRARGITVPREDVLAAVAALELRLSLLYRDRHFDTIRDEVSPSIQVEQLL